MSAAQTEPAAQVVRVERNPLDYCDVCGAKNVHGAFEVVHQNGREVALCEVCA